MRRLAVIALALATAAFAGAASAGRLGLDFTLHKLESGRPGPTLLVVGGIQGDEPGGFSAASLLVTDYHIHAGTVWVVPNLNFESIVRRKRGVYGDMNRKFAAISATDPEYADVQKIKSIILDARVDMILNLHDGSGFYRPQHVDRMRNPHRWGQCVVIDQEAIGDMPFERLEGVADAVLARVNPGIDDPERHYRIKNTHTARGDREMEKTLTYFAIRHGKPAAGIEASKSLPMHERAWHHLAVIEAYMDVMGIDYERGFGPDAQHVQRRIDENVKLAMFGDRIYLDVTDARKTLRYFPMQKNAPLEFRGSNPLIAVFGEKGFFRVSYGNRTVTRLQPQYLEYAEKLGEVSVAVDGEPRRIPIGSIVDVARGFEVAPMEDYRVNVIGFRRKGVRDESGVVIARDDFPRRFSVDRSGRLFRVEFYRDDAFAGMMLVRFVDRPERHVSKENIPQDPTT